MNRVPFNFSLTCCVELYIQKRRMKATLMLCCFVVCYKQPYPINTADSALLAFDIGFDWSRVESSRVQCHTLDICLFILVLMFSVGRCCCCCCMLFFYSSPKFSFGCLYYCRSHLYSPACLSSALAVCSVHTQCRLLLISLL